MMLHRVRFCQVYREALSELWGAAAHAATRHRHISVPAHLRSTRRFRYCVLGVGLGVWRWWGCCGRLQAAAIQGHALVGCVFMGG